MIPIKRQISPPAQQIAVVLALAVGVASGCAKGPPQLATGQVDAAADVSSVDHIGGADALIDSPADIPPDTQSTPPANVLFPDPPEISCVMASDCEFPPSACADLSCDSGPCQGYQWVVYYDNPRCTAGKCEFDQLYFHCTGTYACSGGGCRFNGTAVAAP